MLETMELCKEGCELGELLCSWNLKLGLPPEEAVTISPEAMHSAEMTTPHSGERVFCWQGHDLAGAEFSVTATWKLDGQRLAGRLAFAGNASGLFVEEIHFPVVRFPVTRASRILSPFNMGDVTYVLDPELKNYPAGKFRSFQFCACYQEDGSRLLYFDHRDPERLNKEFSFSIDEERRLTYRPVHFLPLTPENREAYQLPFDNSLVPGQGGWFEAACIYREWAEKQDWFLQAKNRSLPARDLALWIWNRGLSTKVIPPVESIAQRLELPVALDWYWWHQIPYDTDYPEFWPPREGAKVFQRALQKLAEQGIFTQVYINGMSWDTQAASWESGGRESAIVQRNGEVLALAYNSYNEHWLGSMCGMGLPFRQKMRQLARTLHQAGLPGVYLDMIGCGTYYNCYNPQHEHAPGGGNYQVQGYRRMLQEILDDNPGISLSTESGVEAYLDLFESCIILAPSYERIGGRFEVVPAYSAVYHGAIAMFGNFAHPDGIVPFDSNWPEEWRWKEEKAWHRLYPLQFFAELARTIIWGMQPTVCNLKEEHARDPEFQEVYEYILQSARFYYQHRHFLFDGRMLNPNRLQCDTVPVEFMQRTIFTPENPLKTRIHQLPAIFHSCWQNPADGQKALILANYTDQPQAWQWQKLQGELAPRAWQCICLPDQEEGT